MSADEETLHSEPDIQIITPPSSPCRVRAVKRKAREPLDGTSLSQWRGCFRTVHDPHKKRRIIFRLGPDPTELLWHAIPMELWYYHILHHRPWLEWSLIATLSLVSQGMRSLCISMVQTVYESDKRPAPRSWPRPLLSFYELTRYPAEEWDPLRLVARYRIPNWRFDMQCAREAMQETHLIAMREEEAADERQARTALRPAFARPPRQIFASVLRAETLAGTWTAPDLSECSIRFQLLYALRYDPGRSLPFYLFWALAEEGMQGVKWNESPTLRYLLDLMERIPIRTTALLDKAALEEKPARLRLGQLITVGRVFLHTYPLGVDYTTWSTWACRFQRPASHIVGLPVPFREDLAAHFAGEEEGAMNAGRIPQTLQCL